MPRRRNTSAQPVNNLGFQSAGIEGFGEIIFRTEGDPHFPVYTLWTKSGWPASVVAQLGRAIQLVRDEVVVPQFILEQIMLFARSFWRQNPGETYIMKPATSEPRFVYRVYLNGLSSVEWPTITVECEMNTTDLQTKRQGWLTVFGRCRLEEIKQAMLETHALYALAGITPPQDLVFGDD